jgi:hypothetical protein
MSSKETSSAATYAGDARASTCAAENARYSSEGLYKNGRTLALNPTLTWPRGVEPVALRV